MLMFSSKTAGNLHDYCLCVHVFVRLDVFLFLHVQVCSYTCVFCWFAVCAKLCRNYLLCAWAF